MPRFDVVIPAADSGRETVVHLHATDWTEALLDALEAVDEPIDDLRLFSVDAEGEELIVRADEGKRFRIREQADGDHDDDDALLIELVDREASPPSPPAVAPADEPLVERIFTSFEATLVGAKSAAEAAERALDFVAEHFDAESSAVLYMDTVAQDMYFAAARGPHANKVIDMRVPPGKGIVSFSLRSNTTLLVRDVQSDPRFYADLSKSLDYPTTSLVCAPIFFESRTWGCVELVNRDGGGRFDEQHSNALWYAGRKLGEFLERILEEQNTLGIQRSDPHRS